MRIDCLIVGGGPAGATLAGLLASWVEKIGAGGMGVVYRAKDTRLNRIVAYKMLMEQFMEVKDVRERFLREAQSAAQLNHPNIVTVFDVDVDPEQKRLFIAMEFVAGESYFEILQRETRLSIKQTVQFVVGVLKALAHAHALYRPLARRNDLRLFAPAAFATAAGCRKRPPALAGTSSARLIVVAFQDDCRVDFLT